MTLSDGVPPIQVSTLQSLGHDAASPKEKPLRITVPAPKLKAQSSSAITLESTDQSERASDDLLLVERQLVLQHSPNISRIVDLSVECAGCNTLTRLGPGMRQLSKWYKHEADCMLLKECVQLDYPLRLTD